jgi:hypothetical protein
LFQKRIEFSHEKEIRILIRYLDNKDDILKLKISPNDLFDSMLFDPRFPIGEFEDYKNQIIQLGFKGNIEISSLYSIPKLNLKYDNIKDNNKQAINGS